MAEIFRCDKLIRFAHCDTAGIVFYPRFVELFNEVVEDWFEQQLAFGFNEMHIQRGFGFPVARLEVDFLVPSFLGDRVRFELRVNRVGQTSLDLALDGFCGTEHRLTARQVSVMIDLKAKKPMVIPDELREKITRFVVDGSA